MMVKSALLKPMLRAKVKTATSANPGLLRGMRAAKRMSWRIHIQRGYAAPVAVLLLGLIDAAQGDERLSASFVSRHAGADVVVDVQFEMTGELVVQLAVGLARAAKQRAQPNPRRTQPSHDRSVSGARNRARMDVVCFHSRSSFCSCFRPARVSR